MNLNKKKYKFFLAFIGFGFLSLSILITLRYAVIALATQKAEKIIAEVDKQNYQTEDERIKAITAALFRNFEKRDNTKVPLLQLQKFFC